MAEIEIFTEEIENGNWTYAIMGGFTTLMLVGVMFTVYNRLIADDDCIPFYK
jgi:hypothetical protein